MPTLCDKLWESHVVTDHGDGTALLYIDRQLLVLSLDVVLADGSPLATGSACARARRHSFATSGPTWRDCSAATATPSASRPG